MEASDPRSAAFEILRRVEHEGAWSSVLLQQLDDAAFDARDLGLITELVYGVLRRRLQLDRLAQRFSSRPLARIDAGLLGAIRLGLYQIYFLDRIPPHAAVDESVGLARRLGGRQRDGGGAFAAFANGLLRAAARERASRGEGAADAGPAERSQTFPEWLASRWERRFGPDDGRRLREALDRPAPTALRVTSRAGDARTLASRLAAEGIETRPSRWLDDALVVTRGVAHRCAGFLEGAFYIQDEASGLVARLAGAGRLAGDERILDACAAPGGKALALAGQMRAGGFVLAADLHPSRLALLAANARRLRIDRCLALAADFSGELAPLPSGALFDVVLVDAPCSGTGVIRRNPELRFRASRSSLAELSARQRRLLASCARHVRPGGALVYSVCSLEPEEGSEQAAWFLSGHPQFALEDPSRWLPDAAGPLIEPTPAGRCLVTLPHRDDLDGFFAARLRRQG